MYIIVSYLEERSSELCSNITLKREYKKNIKKIESLESHIILMALMWCSYHTWSVTPSLQFVSISGYYCMRQQIARDCV